MRKIKKIWHRFRLGFDIGRRYINLKKKNGRANIIFYSLFAGIAGGLAVLIVVLGVMNGFQHNHISRRIEIGTYHVVIRKINYRVFNLDQINQIKQTLYQKFNKIEVIVPYTDREVMAFLNQELFFQKQILKLRVIDDRAVLKDERFFQYMKITNGGFLLKEDTILLGNELASRLFAMVDSKVNLTPDISLKSLSSEGIPFEVAGFFKSGSYDYDRYWAFISLAASQRLFGRIEVENIGLKLRANVNKKVLINELISFLGPDYQVLSAEEINRGYFAALRLEKVMIIFLFLLIFFMAALNTFGALKLTIIEKKYDILILKAIGFLPADVVFVFIIESLILGFGGSLAGVCLGIFISYNINSIFILFETIINLLITYINHLMQNILSGFYLNSIQIYDADIYYQSQFLVKIVLSELVVMSFLIIFMTVCAAYIPVSQASKLKPNELLRKTNL